MTKLKIYLDNCCYNRPFDNVVDAKVIAETEAKLFIQSLVKYGDLSLVSSFVLYSEVIEIPSEYKRNSILNFIDQYACEHIDGHEKDNVFVMAMEYMQSGIKKEDAAHVACAVLAKCDFFITTDHRLLRFKTQDIQLLNPIVFVKTWKEMI